ncbi:G-type lectin S-receptor-like serine/threonine-protein kinase SD1-1 [Arachis hypogaea]|uniref:G-type lectin S-receptor-like serine/threonine-protein kinase SD1-1 n=1 Tax=Arachis hypogaea TaxID=3818 RepID=UPI003B21D673
MASGYFHPQSLLFQHDHLNLLLRKTYLPRLRLVEAFANKNREFFNDNDLDLLGHAWRLWCEERPLELIDESLTDSVVATESEVLSIELLCVQERPENRPDMSAIVLMLNGEKPLPRPRDLLFIHISLAFHKGIVQ